MDKHENKEQAHRPHQAAGEQEQHEDAVESTHAGTPLKRARLGEEQSSTEAKPSTTAIDTHQQHERGDDDNDKNDDDDDEQQQEEAGPAGATTTHKKQKTQQESLTPRGKEIEIVEDIGVHKQEFDRAQKVIDTKEEERKQVKARLADCEKELRLLSYDQQLRENEAKLEGNLNKLEQATDNLDKDNLDK